MLFCYNTTYALCTYLDHRQPINSVPLNNHRLNFNLQLTIFMQQNPFKWGIRSHLKTTGS